MFNEDDMKVLREAKHLAADVDAIEDMNAPEWRKGIDQLHDLLDPIAQKMTSWPDAELERGLAQLPDGFHRSELRVLLAMRSAEVGPGGP